MVVENTSVISKEDAFEALYISTKNNLNKKYIYGGLIFLAGLFVLAYGIYGMNTSWIIMGGMFSAIGIAYIVYNMIMIFRAPKDIQKRNKLICENGVTYKYRFREQGLDLECISAGKRSKITYTYDTFKKVYEYENRFEIRLDTEQIMYVMKEGFKEPRMIEFFKKNISTNKKLKIVNKEQKKKD